MTLASDAIWASATVLLYAGCFGFVPRPDRTTSIGLPASGFLHRGEVMPARGEGFVLARTEGGARYGTPALIGALQRATASVSHEYPGAPPMRIGDLSDLSGGQHARHNSHRSGRDVDVIFYLTDLGGRPVQGRGWVRFDAYGVAVDTREDNADSAVVLFDDARNWHFVRSLLLDEDIDVVWIFCSVGIKARILRYAMAHEPDPEIIFRATWVLHEPSSGRPHDDHFHIRIACSLEDRASGCRDQRPIWSWIRKRAEKAALDPNDSAADEALVEALLAE